MMGMGEAAGSSPHLQLSPHPLFLHIEAVLFDAGGTLLRVTVDPEVFNTGDTGLYAFLDANGRPSHGIVENVIGMGDVYGYLRSSTESANDKGGRPSPSPFVTRIDSAQGL